MSRSKWMPLLVVSMFVSCLALAADKPAAPTSKPASNPTTMMVKTGEGHMIIMNEGDAQPMVINIGEGGVWTTGKGAKMPGAPAEPGMGRTMTGGVFAGPGVWSGSVSLPAMPMIKAAYLGVGAEPVPEILTEQLKLPKGTALAVTMVEENSPAAAVGLKKNDLLIKLDDQLVINLPQLTVLVRMHKAGDEVKITYMRQGQTQTAAAKLVEKEVPAEIQPPPFMPMPGMGPMHMMGNMLGGAGNCPMGGKCCGQGQGQWQMLESEDEENEEAEHARDPKAAPGTLRLELKATPEK